MICADSWLQPLELLLRLLRVVERLADRVLTALERLQQRPPGELRQQRQQDQERDDRPDEQSGIGLDQRVIHSASSALSVTHAPTCNSTISSTNTSARIATPSSRKSGRLTAPVILSAALGWRAMPLGGGRGELADAQRRRRSRSCRARARAPKIVQNYPVIRLSLRVSLSQ